MSRPKLEFVPKTLADLNIDAIHDLNYGRRFGSTQSLPHPRQHLAPSSSVGDLSSSDPLRAWEAPPPPTDWSQRANAWNQHPKIANGRKPPGIGFKPHPAPRTQFNGGDPWTGDIGFLLLLFVSLFVGPWTGVLGLVKGILVLL